jgi:hypothetical protein
MLCAVMQVHSQGRALHFDGNNDYVQLASKVNLGTINFTFEAWVKPEVTANGTVFAQDISGNNNNQFRLSTLNNRARFFLSGPSNIPSLQITTPAGSVPVNEWSHLAVVRNGGTVTLYVNGVPEATGSSAVVNNQSGTDATRIFRIGARGAVSNANGQNNFQGTIDNVRYWNVARTQSEIKSFIFYEPGGNATGLVAWYRFEEGSGSTVNTATSTSGITGTLTNGPAWVNSPIVYGENSLQFDGTNDVVSVGAPIPSNASFTKEAWVYATANSGSYNLISSQNSPFWISGGNLRAGIAGNFNVLVDPGTFPLNTWVHVALTFNDATNTMRLYRNGVLVDASTSVTSSYTSENIYVGSYIGLMNFFQGRLDEVRIWNTALTAAEIATNMNAELNPLSYGSLVMYYTFNQGVISGTNTGLSTVMDQKGSYNGTLNNFALTGSSSNFVGQYVSLSVLPVAWKYFSAVCKSGQVYLQWTTEKEEYSASFVVQRSTDGSTWTDISSVKAAGNSNSPKRYEFTDRSPATGTNYYRIKQKDLDDNFGYSEIKRVLVEAGSSQVIIKNNPVKNGSLELLTNEPVQFGFYDCEGRLIMKKQLGAGSHGINIRSLSKGIYILKAGTTKEKIFVR